MEIDALYTDVVVQRWEKFTGKEAVLEGTGQTFKALSEERHAEQEVSP
jgi:hypothetical protein